MRQSLCNVQATTARAGRPCRDGLAQIRQDQYASVDAHRPPENITSVPDLDMCRPPCAPLIDTCGGNRPGANRPSRASRAHHRLCRCDGDRDVGLWTEPRRRPDHRLLLAVRRRPGIPPELLAGAEPGSYRFRGIGVRSFVRRGRGRHPVASSFCCA